MWPIITVSADMYGAIVLDGTVLTTLPLLDQYLMGQFQEDMYLFKSK